MINGRPFRRLGRARAAAEKFTPSHVAVPDAFFVCIVALAAWVMSKIEGRKIGQYGLPFKHGLSKHLWLGLWIGFLASSVTVLVIYLLHGYRGYAQYTLATGIGFWPAAAVLSALFGWGHLGTNGENIFGALSVVCFGLLLCLFLRRTGTLWCVVGFHLGSNAPPPGTFRA